MSVDSVIRELEDNIRTKWVRIRTTVRTEPIGFAIGGSVQQFLSGRTWPLRSLIAAAGRCLELPPVAVIALSCEVVWVSAFGE